MPLTAIQAKQAQPRSKPYKLADSGGLHLLVQPTGAKYWRYRYRFAGKQKTLALGVYPEVLLKEAREQHLLARSQLSKGIDPSAQRRVEKLTRHLEAADTFEAIGREWFGRVMPSKSQSYRVRTGRILEKDLYPALGHRPINSITPPELLAALRKIENRGALDIAHRAKQAASLVFRYAIASGRCERDPSRDITGALTPKRAKKHHAAITDPAAFGQLLLALDQFQGSPTVKTALLLSPLLFQRPGEIRSMEWQEVNWDWAQWEIPASKMKCASRISCHWLLNRWCCCGSWSD